jgi:type I pantothenate kinase
VKSGEEGVTAPVYSHLVYDIVPGEKTTVNQPDILIVEGLNVLQPPRPRKDGSGALVVSDFFDFTVYVDASERAIRNWYVERFLHLRETAFRDPSSYFTRFAELTEDEAVATAGDVWDTINGPNLVQNIRPTRGRATVVLRKGLAHNIEWVRIRKV